MYYTVTISTSVLNPRETYVRQCHRLYEQHRLVKLPGAYNALRKNKTLSEKPPLLAVGIVSNSPQETNYLRTTANAPKYVVCKFVAAQKSES